VKIASTLSAKKMKRKKMSLADILRQKLQEGSEAATDNCYEPNSNSYASQIATANPNS
jgi:hypothetical protein